MSFYKNISEFIAAVKAIRDERDCTLFFGEYVKYLQGQTGCTWERAREIARANIGYVFAEGMSDDQIRMWHDTTRAVHPILGTNFRPTPEEAIEAGRQAALRMQRGEQTCLSQSKGPVDLPAGDDTPYRRKIIL
jgi:hypothetical protein